jgi:hypothetical protein
LCIIYWSIKKPLAGLDYFAGGFRARGFLTATGFSAGAALGLAGALGFLAGAVATAGAGSVAGSVGRGNGQSVAGASTL